MKIIVSTDSFKGSLSAQNACEIIADTIAAHLPGVKIVKKPIADGGEGTATVLMAACNGQWIPRVVMGPLPDTQVNAGFVWFEDTCTALVEMACSSGITLLSEDRLNPLKTTTYGTGQLIKAALKKKPRELLLAIGGSATIDVGIGAAMALGWNFLDKNGIPVGLGGGEIERIRNIVSPSEKNNCIVKVLSDVDNPLYGPNGAAHVFGPQKGADPETVMRLDSAIGQFSDLIKAKLNIDVSNISGAGAAGGLGAGAVAFMGAEIVSGIDSIIKVVNLKEELQNADWIVTGEGKFDRQSLQGKVISGILKLAQQTSTKVFVIAGDIQLQKSSYTKLGIIDAIGLKGEKMTTEYAMRNCEKLLKFAVDEFVQKHLSPDFPDEVV